MIYGCIAPRGGWGASQSTPAHDQLKHSFGLIDETPERWENLKRDVAKLQAEAPADVQYKVFFLGEWGARMPWGRTDVA